MKNLCFLIVTVFLFGSCRTMEFSSLNYSSTLDKKLPPLEPDFNLDSFGPDYIDLYDIPNIIISGRPNVEHVVRDITIEHTIALDTRKIFEREVIHNITLRTGKTKGYAVCSKGSRSKGIKSYFNPIASVLTLGVANLFGMTAAVHTDELEIIVDIFNIENEIVASYAGLGKGEAKVKMYTGYNVRDAKRMAHARAFVNALEVVKFQIQEDHQKVSDLLMLEFPVITEEN